VRVIPDPALARNNDVGQPAGAERFPSDW
jgi:hypothetical protein